MRFKDTSENQSLQKGICPQESDVGRMVIYRGKEQGRITSFNDKYVFVDYQNTGRGVATSRQDLEWMCD